MAEKEERIYIDVENDNLDRLKHLSMTRQEAIERMAKALCLYDDDGGCKGCNPKCYEWKYRLDNAEVALEALLEADK
jgi:hypothetical protein